MGEPAGQEFPHGAEDWQPEPKIVMRDNDTKYTAQFEEMLISGKVQVERNPPVSPNLRAHVERFIQTLKVECLSNFVIVGERHLNYVCREWQLHYNVERPHSARGHLPPGMEEPPVMRTNKFRRSEILCTTRLGGLLRSFARRAAKAG